MPVHQKAREIATYIWYEWDMLKQTAAHSPYRGGDRIVGNAILESFLMHARVLKDFLYGERKATHADDVLATHFFDDPAEWTTTRPPLGPYLTQHERRLQKMVAHFSYERPQWRGPAKNWKITNVRSEIHTAWEAFYN